MTVYQFFGCSKDRMLCIVLQLMELFLDMNNEWVGGGLPAWGWWAALGVIMILAFRLFRHKRRPALPIRPAEVPVVEAGTILPYRSSLPQLASELARARRYQYPLTMLVLQLDIEQLMQKNRGLFSMKKTEPGFINLLLSFVGSLLRASLRDIDIVSFDLAKTQYVVLLPETTLAKAERPVSRLNEMSLKQTGVSLLVGMAEFPTDGLIIEDLVSSAEGNCRRLSLNENGRGMAIKDKQRSHSPQTIMQP